MAENLSLAAAPRDTTKTAKVLRRLGTVPGTLYGREYDVRSLQFEYRTLQRTIRSAGTSRFVELAIEGVDEENTILVRDVQRDPVTDRILHVDLYRILAGQEIRNQVPLVLIGEAPVKELGAMVSQVLESIEVLCLPKDMPSSIECDLTPLTQLNSRLAVGDLTIPEGVEVLTAPDTAIVQIAIPRGLEEEEEGELAEGEEGEEGEPGEEGEAEEGADAEDTEE